MRLHLIGRSHVTATVLYVEEGVKSFLPGGVLHVDLAERTMSAGTATARPSLAVGKLREHLVSAPRVNIHLLMSLARLSVNAVNSPVLLGEKAPGLHVCAPFTAVLLTAASSL